MERTRAATAPQRAARDDASDSIRDGLLVGRVLHVEEDDFPFDVPHVRIELVEAVNDQNVGLEAFGGCPDTVAQPEHHEGLTDRFDELRALATANPVRNHDLFGPNVLQAIALHL